MKRIVFAFIIILAVLSIVNSIRSIYSLWKKQDVLVVTQKELTKDKKENERLKKELAKATSQGYVEEEARNKLFMTKPGENTVYIPKEMLATRSAEVREASKPNWQQWWELFF